MDLLDEELCANIVAAEQVVSQENVKIGDLVLELNPNHKRSQWEMAWITDTYPVKDGLVRKVCIRTRNGKYDRPIHKLCIFATEQELSGDKQ